MKKTFKVFVIRSIEVCTPSTDFYSRSGDWQTETVANLVFVDEFDSEEEAIKSAKEEYDEFTILPFYEKIK